MHEQYRNLNFDVALLQLTKPIQMSSKARSVCLPEQGSRIRPGSQCYITGTVDTEKITFFVFASRRTN